VPGTGDREPTGYRCRRKIYGRHIARDRIHATYQESGTGYRKQGLQQDTGDRAVGTGDRESWTRDRAPTTKYSTLY
jgi:hypothetical protein